MSQTQQQQQEKPTHPKYNAIHRALLTGLLSNVGLKTDVYEYTGVRTSKFSIFPGSGLFKKRPQWIMAAELVETTRLYARTVALIQPKWIEQTADHIVKKEYWEPHWHRQWADVVAWEKITLGGLTLVAKRLVPYGPIDPKASREIFIQQALVAGQYRTDGAFFQHNQTLIQEIEQLEAKSRKRDVLVDPQARFAFYDARLPEDVYNGQRFEHWRKQVERKEPRKLFMSRQDLMLHGAEGITEAEFPDAIVIEGLKLPLSYHLDPGHPADGVTVTIPLAALNQVPAERFEWLVPGLLLEKVTELIRTLPKSLRVNLVPAPEFAQRALDELKFAEGSLYEQLSWHLGRLGGVPVPREAWQPAELPEYLRMSFCVIDAAGKVAAQGRDLEEIRRMLAAQVRSNFALLPPSQFNRRAATRWDFGDLPRHVDIRHYGMTLTGYPALVEQKDLSVQLCLFDTAQAADEQMRRGLRRLFMKQMAEEIKWLGGSLRGFEQMSLNYSTLGSAQELKDDLITAIADRAFIGDKPEVRTQMEFELRLDWGWNQLSPMSNEVCELVGKILEEYHAIAMELASAHAPQWAEAIGDINQQLSHLLPKRFITETPYAWLRHFPRYIKGMLVRLQRLVNFGFAKDARAMEGISPLWQMYTQRLAQHRRDSVVDPELQQYRWMLEEYRVSLFAQELKTAVPVSVKKLEAQWGKTKG